jgi:hypothetical protein
VKKYLLSAAALVLFATGAEASTTYVLNNVTYVNSFATNPVGCVGCGTGTAVDDGAGNITLTGVAWSFAGGGNSYTASVAGTTTLAAGTTLINSGGTCTYGSGTNVCDPASIRSGWGQPGFYTGIASDGTTPCGGPPTNTGAIDRCRVDLALAGSTLTMEIKRALSESTTSSSFQKLTFTFAVVPVPAAVWLFGSALGLLGVARRRAA